MAGEIKKLLLSDGVDVSAPSELGLIELAEGSWTPVLKEGANTLTVASVAGCYKKIGKFLYAAFSITDITPGAATGVLTIEGLPFAASAGCPTWVGQTDFDRFNMNVGATTAFVAASSTIISFSIRSETAGGSGSVTADLMTGANTADINGTIIYATES